MTRHFLLLLAAAVLAALAACAVGPTYRLPDAARPASYKELAGWKPAEPKEAGSAAPWWAIYDDPVLDDLEKQIDISNQTLKASEAAFREASAIAREARAGYFPTVSVAATGQRAGASLGSSGGGSSSFGGGRVVQNSFGLTPTASWAPDIWGRIRRTVESAVATAQASAADLAGARLSAQAALAIDYMELRSEDGLKRILDAGAAAEADSLKITRNQYAAGVAAQTDVITAETQLEGTQAQAINVGVLRAQLEHAIAVLIDKPPSEFSIAPAPLATAVPVAPTGLPSTLLERRPDIAAAERAAAAANAQIGVAMAAYYPDITLSVSDGFTGAALGSLIEASNTAWTLGAAATETVFNGGLIDAQVAAARALYEETVANYRQTVLAGFQQVEDELAALRVLEQEAAVEDSAVKSANEAVRLTLNQYQAGTVAYTSVVVAQTTALDDQQSALTILQNRLVASATLIEALGGGWEAAQLPSAEQLPK